VNKTKVFSVIAIVFSLGSISSALNIIYVDVNGPNDPGMGRFEDPFRRIQSAIDDASEGDIIEIRAGLYTGEGNYDLDPNGAAITIRSTDPNNSNVTANTIIDPNDAGRGFYFHKGEDANCVVAGLTLRNCATNGSGGAICCENSSPTIKNCVIISNTAVWGGGGIICWLSSSTINNCIIADNTTKAKGGGIWSTSSNISVVNCTISGNFATQYGGGVNCSESTVAEISNSILWANEASGGSQVALDASSAASINYSDVDGGESAIHDPCDNLFWDSVNNIEADPCFAWFDGGGDANLWDFHLASSAGRWDGNSFAIDFNKDGIVNLFDFAKLANVWFEESTKLPEDLNYDNTVDAADLQIIAEYFLTAGYKGQWVFDALTSPCVDAGDPNSNWNSEPWPNGKRINMGAYGGTYEASKNGNLADFNVDGTVNFVDFATLASKWMVEQSCIEDLNRNGIVNFADLDMFSNNWLWQKE
jgi:hypothetical protein